LTDAHPDRLLGAGLLGAPLVASRQAYDNAATYTDGFWRSVVDRWARRHPDAADELDASNVVMPQVLFSDTITLRKGGEDVVLTKIEGAAPGSIWMCIAEQSVLFAGDTVVSGFHPTVASSPDTGAWLETLRTLRRPRFSEVKIVPGKGLLCDGRETQALSDYLVLARRRIRSLHAASRPSRDISTLISELLSAFPVPPGERDWVQRCIKADLDQLYSDLQPEPAGTAE
jgi:glyoxylase-like metal-dependent hydrolase (beta-lactamase superfamily II)